MTRRMGPLDKNEAEQEHKIKDLIASVGADPNGFDADLVTQVIETSLKMAKEGVDTGQLKLMTRAFKEMRYAYSIFNQYPDRQRVSIFGSARTPENHPDYQIAKAFAAAMTKEGWVCITGAADGIMKAGLEGAEKESSFGLSIRLPFETASSSVLAGDPKLITFRYFFTRKLMFISHSHAVAAFPGGVGTHDELFEVLTLMQTGKSNIIPVVLLEGDDGKFWDNWENYLRTNLLSNGWISEEDFYLFYRAQSVEDAVENINQFYRRYHSSRYVRDILIIRLESSLTPDQITFLNENFKDLISNGVIYATEPLPEEMDHLNLPRIAFEHNRKHYGLLRKMMDTINNF